MTARRRTAAIVPAVLLAVAALAGAILSFCEPAPVQAPTATVTATSVPTATPTAVPTETPVIQPPAPVIR